MAEQLNVTREVAALKRMTVKELRGRYVEVFGETTRSGNKDWLWKRIAWRVQANAEGDLVERARRLRARAEELANDADLRIRHPRDPLNPLGSAPTSRTRMAKADFRGRAGELMPGTILSRQYKGREIHVTVLDAGKGFMLEGEVYASLSAVAKAVTGSHWSGNYFFGLTSAPRRAKAKDAVTNEAND
ncbi:MAG: DUF2924 domain-containing protein [Phycisphaeraceae bacterium]|nr:DUF2924 domain-containing protein [Phycisphaeraceae bacterium]